MKIEQLRAIAERILAMRNGDKLYPQLFVDITTVTSSFLKALAVVEAAKELDYSCRSMELDEYLKAFEGVEA